MEEVLLVGYFLHSKHDRVHVRKHQAIRHSDFQTNHKKGQVWLQYFSGVLLRDKQDTEGIEWENDIR